MTAELGTQTIAADAKAVAAAVRCLSAGGLVAFPTETVYGLGADAGNGEAVARLYAAKGRPAFNPLIAHVGNLAAAQRLAVFDSDAERLAQAYWPGPLTLVLPKRPACAVSDLALAGLDSIALRVPAHPVARDLLLAFQKPIVAPSANRSGHISPTSAAHVLADLRGRIDLIVDAGRCPVGVESTIVSCLGSSLGSQFGGKPALLRPGGLPREAIERTLGHALAEPPRDPASEDDAPLAPGMLASHYAPKARLRLEAETAQADEALLAFGPAAAQSATPMFNLSAHGDLIEAAANLFSHLRALDALGVKAIAVMKIPREGLGEAINDRLARAAAAHL